MNRGGHPRPENRAGVGYTLAMRHTLTFGAHLLLWVFPALLTFGVIAAAVLNRAPGEDRP